MTMTNEAPVTAPQVGRKIVYTVTERGEKSFWTRIGAAFINKDGSMTVRLEALPLTGVLQIREDDFSKRNGGGQ